MHVRASGRWLLAGPTIAHFPFFFVKQNGDLNWILQKKILAFAGPSYTRIENPEGNCTSLAPADHIPHFTSSRVGLVIRLNEKNYNEEDFVNAGIDHLDQCFPDGSCPSMSILQRVIQAMEAVPSDKAIAIHCKAGLGRTGVCIGAYLMKHYRLTAANVISWMRICRPGMVIGRQQHFLEDMQPVMWQEGEMLKVTTKCLSWPRIRGKKRTTRSATIAEGPLLTAAADATIGQEPGQAEHLLASRQKRQHMTTVASVCASTSTKIPSAEGPSLITPDSAATTTSSSFAEDDLS